MNSSPTDPSMAEFFQGLSHPLRIRILRIWLESEESDPGAALSAIRLTKVLEKQGLTSVSYHIHRLRKAGIIELSSTRKVRGATEHLYRLRPRVRKVLPRLLEFGMDDSTGP